MCRSGPEVHRPYTTTRGIVICVLDDHLWPCPQERADLVAHEQHIAYILRVLDRKAESPVVMSEYIGP